MLSRSSLGRGAQRALRGQQCCAQHVQRRGLAAPASGSFQYQTGEAAGTKVASRELSGPTATLALVAKAGTRYQPAPGLTEGLENFAFLNTEKRSALRIVREVELLGGELSSYSNRENIVLGAKFLREDLPYFVELFGEIASKTIYAPHILEEQVVHLIQLHHKKYLASAVQIAQDSAHGIAFHRGLGSSLKLPGSKATSKYLDAEAIADFASSAYAKSNIAVVANGATQADLSKWVNQFFTGLPSAGSKTLTSAQTKYYGGEERIPHAGGNAIVLAFPGSSSSTGGSYKPEAQVLASLLGGKSTIKWSPGFSLLSKASSDIPALSIETESKVYSDAGLLTVTISGSATSVSQAAQQTVKALQSIASGEISKEDIAKAKALSKFNVLESGQNVWTGLELTGSGLIQGGKAVQLDENAKSIDAVTDEKVKAAAKQLLAQKVAISAVGDLHVLPYAEELGLNV